MGVVGDESRVQKGEKDDPKKDGGQKRACLVWPFEVFVLALGKDFFAQPTVPVSFPGAARQKDELGMRQGGEGEDLPASVCAMISTPGSARGHEGKAPAVRLRGRFGAGR